MSDLVQDYVNQLYENTTPRVRAKGLMAFILAASILWALMWLLYRAYQVCQTPNEVLVDKLGLDIPPTPEITLEDIQAREIRISWKIPDTHHSIHKHVVQVNGTKIGESKRSETAAVVCNLLPNSVYNIRVCAVSAASFQTPSTILHIRTKQFPPGQGPTAESDGQITIRPYVPPSSSLYNPPSAPVMTREHSGSQSGGKRPGPNRKHSPANIYSSQDQGNDEIPRGNLGEDSNEPLEQLAERLKNLQAENEAVERQILQEDEEFRQLTKELEEARDESKHRVKERNEASGDLRKQVNVLENNNRSAQNEKNKKERLLQQKESEYKKRRDDITRWSEQVSQLKEDIARIKDKKAQAQDESTEQIKEIDAKILEQQLENKTAEEDLRVNGLKIKKLEEERKQLMGGDENEEAKETERLEKERDREWESKMNSLRARYASLMGAFNQAQTQYHEAQERLKWLSARQQNNLGPSVSVPALELDFSRKGSKRRSRHRSSLQSNISSPVASYPIMDTAYPNTANYSSGQGVSPTFAASSTFFNINNGMALPGPSEPTGTSLDSDIPAVFTPMSPRADALLPSDLLGDEEPIPLTANLARGPTSPGQFPGLGSSILPFEVPGRDGSPASSASRSASIFSSPRESLSNLQDPDRNSLHQRQPDDGDSTQSASRRLSGFFGFNRQRGKTLADGPPLLGTLKPGQSQSFPRNMDQGLDPIGTRRRRLSYTGNWPNMGNLFPRSTTTPVDSTEASSSRMPSTRRSGLQHLFTSNRSNQAVFSSPGRGSLEPGELNAGYNQFSPRHDPIDPSILLPLRNDKHSPKMSGFLENQLPKPVSDNPPFGWNASDVAGMRGSPLGLDWSSPQPWSRSHSRRPSVQYGGSSTNLALVPSGESDYLDAPHDMQRPLQAPIGTRPTSSQRPVTPKLNPAAPSFKTLFTKRPENDKGRVAAHERTPERLSEDLSSPHRRSFSNSVADSYESLELVPSATPSDGAVPRETFIQRITRKSSSSKFNIPWKDRAIFSKKGENITSAEGDEEGSPEAQLGKSVGSISSLSADRTSKSSSLSFSFMRKGKKADKAMSESSEKGGETGDEEGLEV